MTPRFFKPFALGIFAYTLLVVLWGYFLRISESGDGCGTDWPLCHGSVIPEGSHFPTWVEFIHRVTSGVTLLLVLLLVVVARRAFPPRHPVRWAAGLSLLFTLTESLFGAILVLFGWVATDISTARILIRPFHVTNTFLLMAALALTAWWAWREETHRPQVRAIGGRMGLALFGILALAWTGSWTGLAGTAFPASTVAEGVRQYLDPEHILIYLRMTHPLVAVVAALYLGRVSLHFRGMNPIGIQGRLATGVGVLAGAQLLVGPLTILLLQPAWLRLFHLFLADLLWVGTVLLAAEVAKERHSGGPLEVG